VYGALLSVAGSKYVGANADKVPCLYDCTAKYVRPPCKLNNTENTEHPREAVSSFYIGELNWCGDRLKALQTCFDACFSGGESKTISKAFEERILSSFNFERLPESVSSLCLIKLTATLSKVYGV